MQHCTLLELSSFISLESHPGADLGQWGLLGSNRWDLEHTVHHGMNL